MVEPVAQSVVATPAPALRPFVTRYIGYRFEGFAPGVHRGLPSPHLNVILSVDDPIDVAAMPVPDQAPGRFAALVSGLHARPASIRHDGTQHGIHVELSPLGIGQLLGVPAGELASTVLPLEDFLGPSATELVERVRHAGTWRARFSVLDQILTRRCRDGWAPSSAV